MLGLIVLGWFPPGQAIPPDFGPLNWRRRLAYFWLTPIGPTHVRIF
jgi:hypothetical protein